MVEWEITIGHGMVALTWNDGNDANPTVVWVADWLLPVG